MLKSIQFVALGVALGTLFAGSATAQIGGTGWTPLTVNFKIQSPTNVPESARYFFTNNIFHCLVFSNDGAFSVGNTTLPRTEQRFNPDYTNGEIQYQATLMAPANENSYCVFQIHTGDAESDAYGSTTFMAFWFTNYNGSVHDYSGTTLATNLGNQWFQLNVDHNLVTESIRVWINRQLVWTQQDNGAGDFYFKDGVYEQSHGPTYEMDTYITNTIQEWIGSGTNPPAAPTGLTATPTGLQISLSWNVSVGATNYDLLRSTNNGGPYALIASLPGTNYTDTTASSGLAYYYVVSALDQFGVSANSTQVAASLSGVIPVLPGTLEWTNGSASLDWSAAFNWNNLTAGGYGPPGASNSVLFTNWGAVTASALTAPGSGVVLPTNLTSVVNGSFSVIGLTNFANAAAASPVWQNLGLAAGATLTAGGVQVGGFGTYDFGSNNVVNLSLSGAGATLLVTNGGVTVSQGSGGNGAHDAALDLSGLDNFVMNGTQIRLGVEDITRAGGVMYLAKTNSLTLSSAGYVNSDGSGSPYSGNPALYLGHNKSALGNGTQMFLGIASTITVDYATVGRGDANDVLAFNPAFLAQNPSVTIQGLGGAGTRVGVYVVGDNSAGEGGSTSDTNDFTGGAINALVNYLCVGRGRQGASDTTACAGTLTFDAGSVDANTLAIGFLYPSGSNSIASGTVNVNGGTLTTHSNLTLAARPDVGGSGSAQGILNVNGGTVQAANLAGGGGVSTINLNSGTLNLTGPIAAISTLNVGAAGVNAPALLTGAASINVSNVIMVAANGTLAGNTFITSPGLVLSGTLFPGINGTGAATNSAWTTFGAGGSLTVIIQNATGAPATGWNFLQTGGLLDVEASNASPFIIRLQSFDAGGSGLVTNFNPGMNYAWTIAAASVGITNFSADKFIVDTGGFQNGLDGGAFSVQTNANSLLLLFTSRPNPPVIGGITLNGTNLAVQGSGGASGGNYYVLASTNLAQPVNQWPRIATNTFDGTGNFNFTNPLNSNPGGQFYRLQLP